MYTYKHIQWVPQLFKRLEFFHVNKSGKIGWCGNETHQIIQNMILSRGFELKLRNIMGVEVHTLFTF